MESEKVSASQIRELKRERVEINRGKRKICGGSSEEVRVREFDFSVNSSSKLTLCGVFQVAFEDRYTVAIERTFNKTAKKSLVLRKLMSNFEFQLTRVGRSSIEHIQKTKRGKKDSPFS